MKEIIYIFVILLKEQFKKWTLSIVMNLPNLKENNKRKSKWNDHSYEQ